MGKASTNCARSIVPAQNCWELLFHMFEFVPKSILGAPKLVQPLLDDPSLKELCVSIVRTLAQTSGISDIQASLRVWVHLAHLVSDLLAFSWWLAPQE